MLSTARLFRAVLIAVNSSSPSLLYPKIVSAAAAAAMSSSPAATEDSLKPVVICGPSGVGKGTLIDLLFRRFPGDQFGFSVSHTTRPPREGERDGVHYHFTTADAIERDIADGKFIEYAEVHGRYYGTSVEAVESVRRAGRICVLDIDVQGVRKVKRSSLSPHYVFVAPPSPEELERRLRGRGTEGEEQIRTRLANARAELEYGREAGNFHRVFVNADLKECLESMVRQFKEWYPHLIEVVPEDEPRNCTSKCVVS
jgi:guanylate kinase